ncbi:Antitoxin igA-2 (plasmid) [Variovorax sp. WDL1]|nr:Antitoxin HigA-2 [Variovorax sp. B2]PNG49658.1 Antitoxin HigA-2 [Variovorax sp. B4]VTV18659.1 Antitoxin igA-2 [Variovorax sp. WDL1]
MQRKQPMTDAELEAWEASRDLEAELLLSARQMAAGKTRKVYTPVAAARQKTGLSQDGFASLLGVSVRTLQQWEQGRREPTGAAKTLLTIAARMPEAFRVIDPAYTPPNATGVVREAESAVEIMKSAVAAANHAFESVQRAVKQVSDIAEANFSAVSETAANAAKRSSRTAAGTRSRQHGRA